MKQRSATSNNKSKKTTPLSPSATIQNRKDFSAAVSFKLDEITTASLRRDALRNRAGATRGSGHVTAAASSSKGTGTDGASRGAATQAAGSGARGGQVRGPVKSAHC